MNKFLILFFLFSSFAHARNAVILNTCQKCNSNQFTKETLKGFSLFNGVAASQNGGACPEGLSNDAAPAKEGCGLFVSDQLRIKGQGDDCYRPLEMNDDVKVGELWIGPSNQVFRVASVEKDPFRIEEKISAQPFKFPEPQTQAAVVQAIKTWCNNEVADASKFGISVVQLKNKVVDDVDAKTVIPALGSAGGNSAWVTYLLGRAQEVCLKRVDAFLVSEGKIKASHWVEVVPESSSANNFLILGVDHSRNGCSLSAMNCGKPGDRK